MVQSCLSGGNSHRDLHVGFKTDDDPDDIETMDWVETCSLTVVVVGASGDLAKKKTFPSLLNLYADKLLPDDTIIYGYARSQLTDDDLRDRLRPFLEKSDHSKQVVDSFLARCHYQGGKSYGDKEAFQKLQANEQLAVCFRFADKHLQLQDFLEKFLPSS